MNLVVFSMAAIIVTWIVGRLVGFAAAWAIVRAEDCIRSFDNPNRMLHQWWILAGGGSVVALWMSSNYLLPRTAPDPAFPLFGLLLIGLPVATICASMLAANTMEGSIEG